MRVRKANAILATALGISAVRGAYETFKSIIIYETINEFFSTEFFIH